jgi:hypothetical protein
MNSQSISLFLLTGKGIVSLIHLFLKAFLQKEYLYLLLVITFEINNQLYILSFLSLKIVISSLAVKLPFI